MSQPRECPDCRCILTRVGDDEYCPGCSAGGVPLGQPQPGDLNFTPKNPVQQRAHDDRLRKKNRGYGGY